MARKAITQRIALDGSKDIESQLKALGAAGEKAFKAIQDAARKADLDKFTASLGKVGSDLATVGRRVALLGAGLATAAAGAGVALFGLAKSSGEVADNAGKAAEKTGLQVEAYSKLAFAAEMANVSNEQFVGGMSKLNRAIADAASKTTKAGDAFDQSGVKVTRFGAATKKAADATKQTGTIFDRLGIKIRDANGNLRTNEAILLDVADAFARMPDSALKSALAIELFGKAGAELLPFLNEGKAGLFELGEQAKKLGIVLTDAQAAIGDDLGDSLDSVKKAAAGARLQLGLVFAPGFTALANGFADIIANNRDVLIEFGQAINQKVLSVVGDLLHLLSGNAQNIKNPWVKAWSAAILQFGQDVSGVFNGLVLPAFKALREGAQFVADQINRLFGSDITAGELALGAAVLSLVGVFTLLGSVVGAVVAGIGLLAGIVGGAALAIAAAALAAGIAIAVFWDDIKAGAAATWQFISDGAAAAWQAIVDGATGLWDSIVSAFQEGQQAAVDAFNSIVDSIIEIWTALSSRLGEIATAGVNLIVNAFSGLKERIAGIWNAIADTASAAFGRIGSFIDNMISRISAAIARLKELVGLGKSAGSSGGGGGAQGFASGGYLATGPGSPTSDSIPIWASVKEFITRAKAVAYYGPDVYHAMNHMKIPREFFRSIRGFKLGGVVEGFNKSMQIPRFAGGGMVPAMAPASASSSSSRRTPIILQLPGGEVIDDLTIGNIALNRLQKFALGSALTSTGRKPRRS